MEKGFLKQVDKFHAQEQIILQKYILFFQYHDLNLQPRGCNNEHLQIVLRAHESRNNSWNPALADFQPNGVQSFLQTYSNTLLEYFPEIKFYIINFYRSAKIAAEINKTTE